MIEITLGEKTWKIRPLTLRRLIQIQPVLARVDELGNVGAGIEVVKAALSRDHAAAPQR